MSDGLIKFKHVNKDGVDYIRYYSVTTSLTLKNWTAFIVPSESIDGALVAAVNAAIKEVPDEILDTLKPRIERVISELTLKVGNKVQDNFSFDEMFPDRE